jgi:hypothetical protein
MPSREDIARALAEARYYDDPQYRQAPTPGVSPDGSAMWSPAGGNLRQDPDAPEMYTSVPGGLDYIEGPAPALKAVGWVAGQPFRMVKGMKFPSTRKVMDLIHKPDRYVHGSQINSPLGTVKGADQPLSFAEAVNREEWAASLMEDSKELFRRAGTWRGEWLGQKGEALDAASALSRGDGAAKKARELERFAPSKSEMERLASNVPIDDAIKASHSKSNAIRRTDYKPRIKLRRAGFDVPHDVPTHDLPAHIVKKGAGEYYSPRGLPDMWSERVRKGDGYDSGWHQLFGMEPRPPGGAMSTEAGRFAHADGRRATSEMLSRLSRPEALSKEIAESAARRRAVPAGSMSVFEPSNSGALSLSDDIVGHLSLSDVPAEVPQKTPLLEAIMRRLKR